MSAPRGSGGIGGISLGGIVVIVGIAIAIFWSLWLGLVVALIGLIAFGGFARGRWYSGVVYVSFRWGHVSPRRFPGSN